MKLTYLELLQTLKNKRLSKEDVKVILAENHKKAGFNGFTDFDERFLMQYRVKAIRYCEEQLNNRASKVAWVKRFDKQEVSPRIYGSWLA